MHNHLTVIFVTSVSVAVTAAPAPGPASRDLLPSARPGSTLPVLQVHSYAMSGRVRALLMWVGRDDVGSGVIQWRGDGDRKGYELLIGTDPARAPGSLNKWGYLAEEVQGVDCDVVGVISKSGEEHLRDVRAAPSNPAGGKPFNTIRGHVTSQHASAQVSTVHAAATVTYREADAVLSLAFEGSEAVKQIDRPRDVRPGFLSAVAEVLRTSVARAEQAQPLMPQTLTYVYGDRLYELRLLDATLLARFESGGRTYERVIRGRFETGQMGTRDGSRFELVYGTRGPLAEIPIVIAYQPKWWLQAELTIQP
jgi:hypothetical protein